MLRSASYTFAAEKGRRAIEEYLQSLGPGVAEKLAASGWSLQWSQKLDGSIDDPKHMTLVTTWRLVPPTEKPPEGG